MQDGHLTLDQLVTTEVRCRLRIQPTANQVVAPSKTESGPAAFAKLDTKHRGYVNSEDVSQLQGFNFKNADKNGDGKLDAAEFNAAWAIYSGHA